MINNLLATFFYQVDTDNILKAIYLPISIWLKIHHASLDIMNQRLMSHHISDRPACSKPVGTVVFLQITLTYQKHLTKNCLFPLKCHESRSHKEEWSSTATIAIPHGSVCCVPYWMQNYLFVIIQVCPFGCSFSENTKAVWAPLVYLP